MSRKLGIFLVVVAIWQVVVYTLPTPGDDSPWLLWDPRMGIAFFGMAMHQGTPPFAVSWVSAALLGAVGLALWRSPSWVRTYLFLEAIMSVPTVAMLLIEARAGSWGREVAVPMGLFALVSVAPFVYGIRIV